MKRKRYLSLDALVDLIDEPNRTACRRIVADNRKLFQTVQGSTDNHQAWRGGYFDHVTEIMNIVVVQYRAFNKLRGLPFSLSDALLVVFLHDLEKPWKYELGEDGQLNEIESLRANKPAQHAFRFIKIAEYGIRLTDEQRNGMLYAEGELTDYSSRRRVAGPLAGFCHMADHMSARVWFDYPLSENDPWPGATRQRD